MGNILSRIQEIASNEGITIGALERTIGASKGVLSRAINNGTDIQSKWLQLIVENYPHYSAEWILKGVGDMTIATHTTHNIPIQQPSGDSNALLMLIREKDTVIKEQAEEIGRLKEQIRQMTIEKGKHVSDAPITGTANVG